MLAGDRYMGFYTGFFVREGNYSKYMMPELIGMQFIKLILFLKVLLQYAFAAYRQ